MIRRAVSARRRGVRTGQQGYALMAVLFVIIVCSLLVVALLGLTFATTGLSISQDQGDRRSRAADSALENAVNLVARDATGNLAYPPTVGHEDKDCTLNGALQVGDVVISPFSLNDGTCQACRAGSPTESPLRPPCRASSATPSSESFVGMRTLGIAV